MKNEKQSILTSLVSLILLVFVVSSCADNENQIIGLWDDNIKLSQKLAEFTAESDSVIITTQGDWWWVNGISVNDSSYTSLLKDVDLESENYSIKDDCFVVERRDKNTLFIRLDGNDTGEERLMTITLEAGDYFDYVSIKQLAN